MGLSPIFRTHPQSVPACNNPKRARACLCGSYQGLDQLISQSQLLRRSVDLVKMQTYMHILSDLKQPLTETKASFPLLMTARSMRRRCSQSRLAHWEERAQAHSAVTSAATSLVRHGTQQPLPPFLVTSGPTDTSGTRKTPLCVYLSIYTHVYIQVLRTQVGRGRRHARGLAPRWRYSACL